MAQIGNLNKIVNGVISDADKFNYNFEEIKTKYNAHDTATTSVHNVGTNTIVSNANVQTLIDLYLPVGTVLDVWRPDSISFATVDDVDTDVYNIMDGSTIDDSDSEFDTVTLPDMTNRYIIGAGTEEGEDNLTATTCNATPIGNANHSFDPEHNHTFPDHSHIHTHSGSSHDHDGVQLLGSGLYISDIFGLTYIRGNFDNSLPNPQSTSYSWKITGDSGSASSNNYSGYAVPLLIGSTDSISFSPSQGTTNTTTANDTSSYTGDNIDIQPSSLQVKRYIRYK